MKVEIGYKDNESLTPEEIVSRAKKIFGNNVDINILPNNNTPEGYIYHGIQLLMTEEQVQLFFDKGEYLYQEQLPELRIRMLAILEDTLNQVIIENEERIA